MLERAETPDGAVGRGGKKEWFSDGDKTSQ